MEKIALSESLSLSRITAGCMRILDSGIDGDGLRSFVSSCLDLGIDSFDHAPVYGATECERFFGDEIIRKSPSVRNRIRLVTKAGIVLPGQKGNRHIYYDSRKASLLAEVEASLQRLGTDHLDLLLIHRPDVLGSAAETGEALEEIVRSGKALSVGVSNYEPWQFEALQRHCGVPLAVNQMEFSVVSTQNFFNGVIDCAQKNNTALMAWSPLGGGSVFHGEDEKSLRLRSVIREIAASHEVEPDVVMYAFVLRHPANLIVVTGTCNAARMKNAARALELKLSYDEWYAIMAASRGFEVP